MPVTGSCAFMNLLRNSPYFLIRLLCFDSFIPSREIFVQIRFDVDIKEFQLLTLLKNACSIKIQMNKKGFQSNANHPPADSLHFIVNKFGEAEPGARTTYKEGVRPCTRKGQGPVDGSP